MNPITQALLNGYTAVQILEFVAKKFPTLRKSVETALQSGYDPHQITTHLEKEFEGKANTREKRQVMDSKRGTPTDQMRTRAREMRGKREDFLLKTIPTLALGAAGAAALRPMLARSASAQAAPNVAGLLGGPGMGGGAAGPTGPAPQPNAGGGFPMGQIIQNYAQHVASGGKMSLNSFMRSAVGTMAQQAMQGMQQPQQAAPQPGQQEPIDVTGQAQWSTPAQQQQGQPSPQQAAQPVQQPAAQMPAEAAAPESKAALQPEEAKAIIDNLGVGQTIDVMVKAGNDPEQIAAGVALRIPKDKRQQLYKAGLDLPSVISAYLQGMQPAAPMQAEQAPLPEMASQQAQSMQPEQQAPSKAALQEPTTEPIAKPLSAGATAMLPNGEFGRVSSVEGNRIKLDVDGKEKVAPSTHALPISENAQRYTEQQIDDFINTIPEKDRSTAFYVFQPLGDGMVYVEMTSDPNFSYIYRNVPDDLINTILSASVAPKTTGGNMFGIYTQEVADSRGSPFHELVRNPEKYPFTKIPKGYDLMQMFKQDATALNKKRKKEQKALEKTTNAIMQPPPKPKAKPKKKAEPKPSESKAALQDAPLPTKEAPIFERLRQGYEKEQAGQREKEKARGPLMLEHKPTKAKTAAESLGVKKEKSEPKAKQPKKQLKKAKAEEAPKPKSTLSEEEFSPPNLEANEKEEIEYYNKNTKIAKNILHKFDKYVGSTITENDKKWKELKNELSEAKIRLGVWEDELKVINEMFETAKEINTFSYFKKRLHSSAAKFIRLKQQIQGMEKKFGKL